jgi:hypothetical protein
MPDDTHDSDDPHDLQAYWDDLRPLRGDHQPEEVIPVSPPEDPDPEDVAHDDLLHALQAISQRLSGRREKLDTIRSSLLFLAFRRGLSPSDVPEPHWQGTAGEYRDYAEMIGYVPGSSPSTPQGLRLLGVLDHLLRRGGRLEALTELDDLEVEIIGR